MEKIRSSIVFYFMGKSMEPNFFVYFVDLSSWRKAIEIVQFRGKILDH